MVTTISRGKLVWHEDRLSVEEGAGRFVECPTFGPLYQGLDLLDASYLGQKFPYGDIPVQRVAPSRPKDEL